MCFIAHAFFFSFFRELPVLPSRSNEEEMWARKLLSKQEDKKVDKTRNFERPGTGICCAGT